MFAIVKKLLTNQGGWMAAIPMMMQMGSSIAGMVKGNQAEKRARRKTGEESNYQSFLGDTGPGSFIPMNEQQAGQQDWLNATQGAATSGGLMPAISEAFSQRPNSGEMDAIARQEKNLKNQALNTGARGGLLKQQMFEASKNAAVSKLNVMENARQNALQRAFQTFIPSAPTQGSMAATNQLIGSGLGSLSQMGIARNQGGLQGAQQGASDSGSGLGSILGMLPGLFGQQGGSITNAVGGTPSFSLPGAGEGFSNIFAR